MTRILHVGLGIAAASIVLLARAEPPPTRADVVARVAAMTALGRAIFADPSLSASGRLACATCHSPARAFGPPDDVPVRLGGVDLTRAGHRAVPSLMYLQAVPAFTEHFFESDDEVPGNGADNGPTGGLTWDGRVDRARDQARLPLFSPLEMANRGPADVLSAIQRAPYAAEFRRVFGADALRVADKAVAAVGEALETYQQDATTFYPYSSKYDAYRAGRAALTTTELRGLAAFEDPARGNCARCHVSRPGRDGALPQFTDYGLAAIGGPRNRRIPANADPAYFDLGLCGPDRHDLAARADDCGKFMTPTLRNVATRGVFFHNGVFRSLEDVVAFYAERDVRPEKWYTLGMDGRVRKFDDLPAAYQTNVDMEAPFGGQPGDAPRLSSRDVADIVAFLRTLTDGYAAPGQRASDTAGR